MKGFNGGMAQLMKQANQMQMKMKKLQEELQQKSYQGTAGGGAVTVTTLGDSQRNGKNHWRNEHSWVVIE